MESSAAKRQKMSEPAQTSPNKDNSTISMSSSYIKQYNKPAYIDKTLLIERLFEIPEHALITAPRRFGKSLNMNMARKFFEIEVDDKGKPIVLQKDEKTGYLSDEQSSSKNFKLFEGKKIFKNKKFVSEHFGQYPTIHASFKDVSGTNFQEVLGSIGKVIRMSFKKHSYLLKAPIWGDEGGLSKKTFMRYFDSEQSESLNKLQVLAGLNFLSEFLHAHFEKEVYVFIDEFDAPVSKMIYNNEMTTEDRNKTINFIQELISGLVKDNDDVERSLLTGCHHIAGVLSQGANNVKHYPFMSDEKICEFYGFTEAEVEHLLKLDQYKTKIPEELYPRIHEWYNGYNTTFEDGSKINIYSPLGILTYISSNAPKRFQSYWDDNIPAKVLSAMTHECFRKKLIEGMASPEPFTIKYVKKLESSHITDLCNIIHKPEPTDEDFHLYMQFLYENGYFNLVRIDHVLKELILEIPNTTARCIIRDNIYTAALLQKYHNFDPQKIEDFKKSIGTLAQSCTRSDIINFAKSFEELLLSGSKAPCNESEVQSMLFVFAHLKCNKIRAECQTPFGTRCDVYIVVNVGGHNYVIFIIEIKYLRLNSNIAYQQILDKKYDSLSKVENVRKIFNNEEINIQSKIYLGIHVSDDCKVTITFSFDGKDLKDLEDSNKNVSSNSQ